MRTFILCALLGMAAFPASAQRAACESGLAQPDGSATAYPCDRVDFLGNLSHAAMGGAVRGNDIWGWTDAETDRDYALVGQQSGTAFVDVTDGENPVYLGSLPSHTSTTVWRDMKVYADHAYIVSEAENHGMQVFDLHQLRDVVEPVTFAETAHYDGIGGSHNVVINEASGFAYIVGGRAGTESACAGGLHMVDLSSPAEPTFAGCVAEDGYTHDAQCVIYDGPDIRYTGREICIASNEDRVTFVDVTEKSAPVILSSVIYPNIGYTHQGWLTDDHRYFIGNDEADESTFGINTRTLVFDVSDLGDPNDPGAGGPEFQGEFFHDTAAIDHNLYVRGRYVYQTNDSAGFRILDAAPLLGGAGGSGLEAAAHFDTHPETDAPVFEGAWSSYPYFASGNVIVNDRSRGLFILQPALTPTTETEEALLADFALGAAYPNPSSGRAHLTLRLAAAQSVRAEVYDVLGRRVAELFRGPLAAGLEKVIAFDGTRLPAGTYFVRVTGEAFSETRSVVLTH